MSWIQCARLLVAVLLCTAASPAFADERGFRERYDQAAAHFKGGQLQEAIGEFAALYAEKPVPLLLFNQAQAHRKLGHLEEAQALYQRFLQEQQKPELRSETEGYLREISEALEERKKKEAQEAEERARKEREQRSAWAIQAALQEPAPRGFNRQGLVVQTARPFRVLKWVAAGVGLSLAAAGATFLVLDGRPTCARAEGQALCPQQFNTLTLGAALLGGGVAALGASTAFFIIDARRSREGAQTASLALRLGF